MKIHPYKIEVPQARLEDLKIRLARTRWPEATEAVPWEDGTDQIFLRRLIDHWSGRFDWRAEEARLNRMSQFRTSFGRLQIHFVHERGVGPAPMPLLMTHGWPGSFAEFAAIIPLLVDPAAHGADPADAFDVIAPSLPGYGFSGRPARPGTGPFEIAGLWSELMTRLGYSAFGLQGGDWGASISTWLALQAPERVRGLHLNFIPGSYRPAVDQAAPLSDEEIAFQRALAEWGEAEGAYGHLQRTKPKTLAYALTDSPIGLAAWLTEKFHGWSDCEGELEKAVSLDDLLTNICIYWFTDTVGSSMQLYREATRRPLKFEAHVRVRPPLGVARFPREAPMPPRSWVARAYNVTRWTEMKSGGHFAALEQPQQLAEDIRAFFRPLRA